MSSAPVRNLPSLLDVSKATAHRIRRDDPDYRELVTEYDVGGVTMIDIVPDLDAYRARKKQRAREAKQPIKRRPGRPRKTPNSVSNAV